ncbi:MAG TPA: DUF4124 domain-containing protein [Rhodoferax sp.]|nr:DUF4124 domain-containing protein [Rhodoferax sp.]
MSLSKAFLFGVACLLSASAMAQWQWVDKDGHKVFSDRAPPADIPQKNILMQPAAGALPASPPAVAANAPALAPKVNGKDKELDEKKKQADEAAAAKKKAEEEKVARAKADNCTRARQEKTTLDSGVRIATTNAAGEREVMDDAARAAETQRVQAIIESNCN